MSRILVVDDEPSISWGLSRLVRGMGHTVDVAASAEEGIHLAAGTRPDVLILDVRLPGMDGLTAMESFGRHLERGADHRDHRVWRFEDGGRGGAQGCV